MPLLLVLQWWEGKWYITGASTVGCKSTTLRTASVGGMEKGTSLMCVIVYGVIVLRLCVRILG